jgi:hypothetical protein
MALDVLMTGLTWFIPVETTGKITLATTLLLPLLGVAMLHRAVFGRRSYWPLAAAIVVFNRLFFLAFMGFLDGLGLSLIGAALWKTNERRPKRQLAIAVVIGISIFFFHVLALAFYGFIIFGFEAFSAYRFKTVRPLKIAALAAPFVIPAILYLRAPIQAAHPEGPPGFIGVLKRYYWGYLHEPPGLKFYGLLGPFLTYSRWLDGTVAFIVGALLIVALRRRKLLWSRPVVAVILAMAILYPLVPYVAFNGIVYIDQRIPIAVAFLLFAATSPVLETPAPRYLVAGILGLSIFARSAEVADRWMHFNVNVAEFRSAILPIQPGDRVLVVQSERNDDPDGMLNNPDSTRTMLYNDSTLHLAGLVVVERKAFWPLMFTSARHSIKVMPPYDAISFTESTPPWAGILANPSLRQHGWAPYLDNWSNRFDWVLLLIPAWMPDGDRLYPDKLDRVVATQTADLYRIRR